MGKSPRTVVDEQANDEGLWFDAVTAAEAYIQQELRRLHTAIEAHDYDNDANLAVTISRLDAAITRAEGVLAAFERGALEAGTAHPSIRQVLAWIAAEQDAWATEKYSPADEDARTNVLAFAAKEFGAGKTLEEDSGWQLRLTNYLSRALTLGLDTPLGRQALLKYASSAVALAASAIRLWGDPPKAGVPSGELA